MKIGNLYYQLAIGPDQIQNQALKIAAEEIAPILQFIFQQSLDTRDLPLSFFKDLIWRDEERERERDMALDI